MSQSALNPVAPPEGQGFPLIDLAGTPYECGRRYGQIVVERYPGYRRYLDMAFEWTALSADAHRLVESRAPYLLDLYRGLNETARPPGPGRTRPPAAPGCTSFGVSGSLTASGAPLAGQNKDTVAESLRLYVILRMRLAGGPTILVLAYPGEVLGYGLWSTGMSLFRNSLYSRAEAGEGLSFVPWGLLALAGGSVPEAAELARRHGIAGSGNALLTDSAGRSAAVEFNAGGVSIVPDRDGLCVHANHPEGALTAPWEHYPNAVEREHSRYRVWRLRRLLEAQRGRLSAKQAFAALADHGQDGRGICRHEGEGTEDLTTACVLAEPSRGLLHAVRGRPCTDPPATYWICPDPEGGRAILTR